MISPEQARGELARRELARRELAKRSSSSEQVVQDSGKFGGMSETPTMMERAGTNLSEKATRPLGLTGGVGTILSAIGIPEEDIFPAVGQAVGGRAGLVGATAGATLGQGARQLVKGSFRGEEPDLSSLPREAAITGSIEGLTRGAGKFIFRRQIAKETLGKLGKKLGEMKQALSANPDLSIPSEQVYIPLKEAVEGVAVPHGPQSSIISKWLKFMENNPKLTSKNLIELESDLGEAASFGQIKKGAFIQPSNIKKPALNSIAKDSRRQVSGIVDEMAESSGQKGFKDISKKVAKLLSDPDKTDVSGTHGGFGSRIVAAGAVGGATQNPLIGALTYLGMKAIQSPEVRNAAFKIGRSAPVRTIGTATKLSLSELFRKKKK